jgi:hypothetical protein
MNAMSDEKKNDPNDEEAKASAPLINQEPTGPQKVEESTSLNKEVKKSSLDPKSKKALIWSLVAITVVFSLMATFLAVGFNESKANTGAEAADTGTLITGFFDSDGKKIDGGGYFNCSYLLGDRPSFKLKNVVIASEKAMTVVLPYAYASEESANTAYYVLSTSDCPSTSNLFGHDNKEKQITAIYAGRYYSTIGSYAFSGLTALKSFAMGNTSTSGATAAFGAYAFSGNTALTTVALPNILTSLGEGLFQGCSALTSVSYGGTTSDWAKITQATSWHDATLKNVVCTDGTITL